MNNIKIVAISGPSGSGKTSIVKALSKLYSSPSLFYDDYIESNTYPKDMKTWLANGTNVSEIKTPELVNSLNHLKNESTGEFIFIEEPFGRCRDSMSHLIDVVILLDIPMEVCLSRVIMRNIKNHDNYSISNITNYLTKYDDYFRDIYINTTNQTRESSDLIIQDLLSLELLTKSISYHLKSIAK